MKKICFILSMVLLCLGSYSQSSDSIMIDIEYRQEIRGEGYDKYLVEYFHVTSNLEDKVYYKIQGKMNLFYSSNLSKEVYNSWISYDWFCGFRNSYLKDHNSDTLLKHYTTFINQVNSHQSGEIIKSQKITTTKQLIENNYLNTICIDSVCYPTLKFLGIIACNYEVLNDSILIFNLWAHGLSQTDSSKFNLIINLNTGEDISFYDLFYPETVSKIRNLFKYPAKKPWDSDMFYDGGEFPSPITIGWYNHFCLLPEEDMISVYGQAQTSRYDYNLSAQHFDTYLDTYNLYFKEIEQYLQPWVIDYIKSD